MRKKSIVSIICLYLIALGILLTLFSVVYSFISKKLFSIIDSIYFILIPYCRFYDSGEMIDIIALCVIAFMTIFLLIMSVREILYPKKKPVFSFFLCWYFFSCTFSSVISELLNPNELFYIEYYAPMLFNLVVSVIMFSIEAVKYRKTNSKNNQIISFDRIKNNFYSGVFLLIIVLIFSCTFIYFNATTQIGLDICNNMLILTFIFSLILFVAFYIGNMGAYNKYKKQSASADVITNIRKTKIIVWGSLALFILLYLMLKLVIT